MISLYTKPGCVYCVLAKNLLDRLDIRYEQIDVSTDPSVLSRIVAASGMRTLPQIFLPTGECLGGYEDVERLHAAWDLIPAIERSRRARELVND